MSKDLGRLDLRDIKDNEEKLSKIFKYLDNGKIDTAKTAIVKLLNTPNYFLREFIGKKLVEYHDDKLMDEIIISLIGHKTYGVRAATIFYYYLKYNNDTPKILDLLKMNINDTPWETEQIIHEMWQKHPVIMKKEMSNWANSESDKQRTIAYHAIEIVANDDPIFITKMIEKNIDTDNLEVQKKITNVLTHTARVNPAVCYPFIREWLTKPSENRNRTLNIAMRKLISMALQIVANNKSAKNDEFYILTMQSIKDWKSDPIKSVASMGDKLVNFAKNPQPGDSDN